MENLIILNESKKNDIEFEIEAEGVDTREMKVKFILECKEYDMSFECSPLKDKKWTVSIPPIPHIEKTAYKFHIDVIAEGYYFIPLKGVANIEKSHQVYASNPAVSQRKEKRPVVETPKPTRISGMSIADIANMLIEDSKREEKAQALKGKVAETSRAVEPSDRKTEEPSDRKTEEPSDRKIFESLKPEQSVEEEHTGKKDNAVRDILTGIRPEQASQMVQESKSKFSFKKGSIVTR
jgi:hypothetical protein